MKSRNAKIIKKVKGLLAIARDEKNDEESQSAFILAQKLMIQYAISKHEVEDYDLLNESDKINEESVTIYKRLYWWEHYLSQLIAKNFRVKECSSGRYIDKGKQRKKKIVFYGYGRDLELAKEMYILAYDVILFHTKQYINECYNDYQEKRRRYVTESIKSSYIKGFLDGLSERFEEQLSVLRESYEVMVLVPTEVEESFQEMSADWGTSNIAPPPVEISGAYQEGFRNAKDVDFTRRTINAS